MMMDQFSHRMTVSYIGLLENHCLTWRQSGNCRDHPSVMILLDLNTLSVMDLDKLITVHLVIISDGFKLFILRYQNDDECQLLHLKGVNVIKLSSRFIFNYFCNDR